MKCFRGDSVQRRHLCVGHKLCDEHDVHVYWGDSVVGFVYTLRWWY